MISLYDGELLSLLPSQMAKDIRQICLSHALKKGIQLILDKADMTRTQAMIDGLPERILDALAVELRAPYYREDMPLDKKREIIKRTLLWHLTAGTPSAMRELISIVIGEGSIVEWPDYDEPPYTPGTFDVLTDVRITEEIVEAFIAIIERVKNERSHLRRLHARRRMDGHWYVGAAGWTEPHVTIPRNMREAKGRQSVGAHAVSSPETAIPMEKPVIKEARHVGAAFSPRCKNIIHESEE